jgi:hypothetical protein
MQTHSPTVDRIGVALRALRRAHGLESDDKDSLRQLPPSDPLLARGVALIDLLVKAGADESERHRR